MQVEHSRGMDKTPAFTVSDLPTNRGAQERFEDQLVSFKESEGSCLGSICSVVLFPLKCLGWILGGIATLLQRYLFCCCKYEGQEKNLDWKQTKDAFSGIYANVVTGKGDHFHNQKHFNNSYKKLSDEARHQFKLHICYAIARIDHGLASRAQQEKWANENFTKVNFASDYLTSTEHPVLEEAVREFQNEIERNLKRNN